MSPEFMPDLFMTAFSAMVEGKSEEMSTSELSGGARIHYIFQSIYVKSLEVCISILQSRVQIVLNVRAFYSSVFLRAHRDCKSLMYNDYLAS